jgi:hypothetical protein
VDAVYIINVLERYWYHTPLPIQVLQPTSRTAGERLLVLTTNDSKQNYIEIMGRSILFTLKTLAFNQQEINILSDRQMIFLSYMSDKHCQVLSWLNALHQSTVPYIPSSYKQDWTLHIDYNSKVAFAIQYVSRSMGEVYPEIAINCTAVSNFEKDSSIGCLQDEAIKEGTALEIWINNRSSTSGGPYLRQESSNSSTYYESALLDNSSMYYGSVLLDDDIDDSGMSVAIESDIVSSMDRDVRVVRQKKKTDPSPVYRMQFYAQRFWRHEQVDSNETDSHLPTESSVIDADADESESDYDIEHTNRISNSKRKSKINGEYQNPMDYSSSEDSSHWSIFLQK